MGDSIGGGPGGLEVGRRLRWGHSHHHGIAWHHLRLRLISHVLPSIHIDPSIHVEVNVGIGCAFLSLLRESPLVWLMKDLEFLKLHHVLTHLLILWLVVWDNVKVEGV